MSSFCTNFTPSAMSCAQPWNAPAYIGRAAPACAPSPCARSAPRSVAGSGTRRSTRDRIASSSQSGISPRHGRAAIARPGPHSPGAGTPGGRIGWRASAPASCDSPGSFAPATAWPPGVASTNPLRSGWPSNSGGSSSGSVAGAREADAEHLVGLALVPGRARVNVHDGVQRRRLAREPGSAAARRAGRAVDQTWATTREALRPARRPRTASRRSRSPASSRAPVRASGQPSPARRRSPGPTTASRLSPRHRRRTATSPAPTSSGVMAGLGRPAPPYDDPPGRKPAATGRPAQASSGVTAQPHGDTAWTTSPTSTRRSSARDAAAARLHRRRSVGGRTWCRRRSAGPCRGGTRLRTYDDPAHWVRRVAF